MWATLPKSTSSHWAVAGWGGCGVWRLRWSGVVVHRRLLVSSVLCGSIDDSWVRHLWSASVGDSLYWHWLSSFPGACIGGEAQGSGRKPWFDGDRRIPATLLLEAVVEEFLLFTRPWSVGSRVAVVAVWCGLTFPRSGRVVVDDSGRKPWFDGGRRIPATMLLEGVTEESSHFSRWWVCWRWSFE